MASNKGLPHFTHQARRALMFAQEEAADLRQSDINTGHILLGLLRDEGDFAGRALHDAGLTAGQVRAAIAAISQPGASAEGGNFDLASDTKHLMERTVKEVQRTNDPGVGTIHLLRALLRQPESTALDILRGLGIEPQDVLRSADELMRGPDSPSSPPLTGGN